MAGRPHSLSRLENLHCQNDMLAMALDGKKTSVIIKHITEKYGISDALVNIMVHELRHKIKERKGFEVNNMVLLHLARYEEAYEKLMELRLYGSAQMALRAKEYLLGFHKEDFHMRVSNGQVSEVSIKRVNNEFDLNRLEGEKRDRFAYLMQKCQRTPELNK